MPTTYIAPGPPQTIVELWPVAVEMGVQLNIKDTETARRARELVEATHRPVTQAIKQALEPEALAKERAEPLLFKGDDFVHTDVHAA